MMGKMTVVMLVMNLNSVAFKAVETMSLLVAMELSVC